MLYFCSYAPRTTKAFSPKYRHLLLAFDEWHRIRTHDGLQVSDGGQTTAFGTELPFAAASSNGRFSRELPFASIPKRIGKWECAGVLKSHLEADFEKSMTNSTQPKSSAQRYIRYAGYMENDSAIVSLGALAQGTRLDVFRLLVRHEPDGLAAGDIARQLDVPQNTMSAHLGILARAGLVRSERRSRLIVYRADLDGLRALTLFLVKDCCAGSPELCAPLLAELAPCC